MVGPGQILGGKYQLERVLGQGGMGMVVSAIHLALGQRVAIKFLLPEALTHREAVERFLREARAAVRLRSEHVGRVVDVGTFDDGAPYMVMEFLEGSDLGHTLRQGPLPVVHAVDFVLQACEAVAEAHALGIIHRDLKPANLFYTRRADGSPLIKVLDFGISKAHGEGQDFSLTRTSAVIGSPGYMSPEQLRSSRDVDARSDIWSLGVILYELTTGRQPFTATSITELALKVAMDSTPPLQLPMAPAGFERVIDCCLEKEAAQRFGNVAELAAALVPYGPPSAADAALRIARVLQVTPSLTMPRPGTAGTAAPTTLSSATGQPTGLTPPPPRGSRFALVAGVGIVLAGVAVAAVMIGRSPAPAPAPAPTPAAAPPPVDTAAAEKAAAEKAAAEKAAAEKAAAEKAAAEKAAAEKAEQEAAAAAEKAAAEKAAAEEPAKRPAERKRTSRPRKPTTTKPSPNADDFGESRY